MENKIDLQIKILISAHANFQGIKSNIIEPIALGVANKGKIEGIDLDDATGDNISHLNQFFCEMTAVYWAYKNLDLSWYGFFHYRRYLTFKHIGCGFNNYFVKDFDDSTEREYGLTPQSIKETLSRYDLILPCKKKCSQSVFVEFSVLGEHIKTGIEFCLDYIKSKYGHMFDTAMNCIHGMQHYQFNMFIAPKEIFLPYCDWVFEILFAYHKQKDYNGVDDYQKRTPGFLAEVLTSIYFDYLLQTNKKLRVAYAPVILNERLFKNNPHAVLPIRKTSLKTQVKKIMKYSLPYGLVRYLQKRK